MRLPFAILGYCRDKADIDAAMEAAAQLAEWQVRRGYAPPWWRGRATYRRELHETLPGVERIQLPEELEAMGRGDCDDHAAHLVGSLRAYDWPARCHVVESPGIGYHVVAATFDREGHVMVIDPSARRGMLTQDRSVGAARDQRRRRARAALQRAAQLVAQVERELPGSEARNALAQEAMRQLNIARAGVDE